VRPKNCPVLFSKLTNKLTPTFELGMLPIYSSYEEDVHVLSSLKGHTSCTADLLAEMLALSRKELFETWEFIQIHSNYSNYIIPCLRRVLLGIASGRSQYWACTVCHVLAVTRHYLLGSWNPFDRNFIPSKSK